MEGIAHFSTPRLQKRHLSRPCYLQGGRRFGAAMFSVWAFVPKLIEVPVLSGYGFGATVTEAG